ncbi:hypothetical protein K227x_12390 [Rubripirellula lacrimiformis]|uniref:DUF2062 domain-containing protein n=1 Tax=Rubripirellula lacrimiformis TaxID=1930273 RepID=A0A517N6W8_9BACT|nr:TIGR03546 family protein [Rubripirellula lacrimiformis]QDT02860.1 hypothetical protein K227x_12390 [Rubripirellula lacrimiformis]
MILWTIKLFTTLRRAIAGRRYPHQLAWAVAFGLLLGIIPHGNLLAVLLLILVLSLKLNHAAAGLTAIGVSFLAAKLDPLSHEVGNTVLTNPAWADTLASLWALPMVPWTDLNNTVVMGSFLIGAAALLPVFLITYPVFRMFRPADEEAEADVAVVPSKASERSSAAGTESGRHPEFHPVAVIDRGHPSVARPHQAPLPATDPMDRPQASSNLVDQPTRSQYTESGHRIDFQELDSPAGGEERQVAVETRIEVIRIKEASSEPSHYGAPPVDPTGQPATAKYDDNQPMDEALNYLLRQLRDSQQRKSA